MSQLKVKEVLLGDNADPSKNFVISTPAIADGTLSIKRQDGTNVLSIAADGKVQFPGGGTIGSDYGKLTSPVKLGASADLNWIPKVSGLYYGYSGINTPNATTAIYVLEIMVYSQDWVIQRFTAIAATPITHVRAWHSGTTWGAWTQI